MSPPSDSMFRPALIVHGGAGTAHPESPAQRTGCTAAITAGWSVLGRGGSALDAVCAAVMVLEDDAAFNAGIGSCLTSDGTVEMDAAVMEGSALHAGAVAVVRAVRSPVQLARAVLTDGRHVMLAGPAADAFAQASGVPACRPDELITAHQLRRWQERRATPDVAGTVGAVAVDRDGHVAAATSTGGLFNKLPGRIGDSAIIGAGTYADDTAGAVSATGDGEAIIRVGLGRWVVERLRDGTDPHSAARQGIAHLGGRVGGSGGLIIVDRFGRLGHACNTASMAVAWMRADLDAPTVQT